MPTTSSPQPAVSGLGAPFDCSKLAAGFSTGGRLCGAHAARRSERRVSRRDRDLCARSPQRPVVPDRLQHRRGLRRRQPCSGTETCTAAAAARPSSARTSTAATASGPATRRPVCATVPSIPPNCDDANPCTDDSCDPFLGCLHDNASPCDDSSLCAGRHLPEQPLHQHARELPRRRPLRRRRPPTIRGQSACRRRRPAATTGVPTTDGCESSTGASTSTTTTPAATVTPAPPATSLRGACAGTPTTCNGNVCNGVGTCDITTGFIAGTPLNCDIRTPARATPATRSRAASTIPLGFMAPSALISSAPSSGPPTTI